MYKLREIGRMKYYIYISDAKLAMLYAQLPRSFLHKIASELSINLKLVVTEIGATIKGNQNEITRYTKLQTIVKYIEKHFDVGTIDEPKTYFKGTLPMQWGRILRSGVVYFGGTTPRATIALGGSRQHVLGGIFQLPEQQVPEVKTNELESSYSGVSDSGSNVPYI